jgi:DNA/RNA-binding protein KIN17
MTPIWTSSAAKVSPYAALCATRRAPVRRQLPRRARANAPCGAPRAGEHVRSQARSLYHEVIADRHHIHMNSTRWLTLTEYVAYLGREGLAEVRRRLSQSPHPAHRAPRAAGWGAGARGPAGAGLKRRGGVVQVDQDEEGKWFVRYVNRDPEAEARKAALEKKEKMDMDDAERAAKMVENQIKAAQKAAKARGLLDRPDAAPKELVREEGQKLSLAMSVAPKAKESAVTRPPPAAGFEDAEEEATVGGKRKLSAVEELMLREKRKKEEDERGRKEAEATQDAAATTDHWLHKGIVVKVVHKKLAEGKFYKKKGVVRSVQDKFTAEVKMIDSGTVLRLDQVGPPTRAPTLHSPSLPGPRSPRRAGAQEHLETVIPSAGGEVLIVNGRFRGEVGVLRGIEEDKFCAVVQLEKSGKCEIPYEHVCKLS